MTTRSGNLFMLLLVLFQLILSSFILLIPSMTTLLILSQLVIFLVPSLIYIIFAKIKGEKVNNILKFKKLSLKNILIILAIGVFVQPLMMIVSAISLLFSENLVAEVLDDIGSIRFIYLVFIIAVLPSIFEEIAFRGVIFKSYEKVNMRTAILINGLFFGFMHLNFQQFFYTFGLGILLAFLVYYTKSIFSAMILHFIINSSQVVMFKVYSLFEGLEHTSEQLFDPEITIGIYAALIVVAIASTAIFFALVRLFIKTNPLPPKNDEDIIKPKILTPSFCITCVVYVGLMVFIAFMPNIMS